MRGRRGDYDLRPFGGIFGIRKWWRRLIRRRAVNNNHVVFYWINYVTFIGRLRHRRRRLGQNSTGHDCEQHSYRHYG